MTPKKQQPQPEPFEDRVLSRMLGMPPDPHAQPKPTKKPKPRKK